MGSIDNWTIKLLQIRALRIDTSHRNEGIFRYQSILTFYCTYVQSVSPLKKVDTIGNNVLLLFDLKLIIFRDKGIPNCTIYLYLKVDCESISEDITFITMRYIMPRLINFNLILNASYLTTVIVLTYYFNLGIFIPK